MPLFLKMLHYRHKLWEQKKIRSPAKKVRKEES